MNSIYSASFFTTLRLPVLRMPPFLDLEPLNLLSYNGNSGNRHKFSLSTSSKFVKPHPLGELQTLTHAAIPLNEVPIPLSDFEDFVEKDWSFLDIDNTSSNQECYEKIDRIVSAGEIVETSKVLICTAPDGFVGRVVDSSPFDQLLVIHDSLFVLACIKEKFDKVNCWRGKLIDIPQKWTSFDVLFLYFLPALPFELGEIIGAVAKHCLPGSRLVISHPQGRRVVEEQRQNHPEIVVSGLPEKMTLQNLAADHSFEMVDFVDEPGFYLVVLKFKKL